MNIKLIKNSDNAIHASFADNLLLQIVDDKYEYNDLIGKKYFILNSSSNERVEISPHIKKYLFCNISYSKEIRNYIFYTSLESVTDNRVLLTIYRFFLDSEESLPVYNVELSIDELNFDSYEIFVFDANYFFFCNRNDNSIILHDICREEDVDISDTFVEKLGIYKLIPIPNNKCVLKLGRDKLIYNNSMDQELIIVVNPKQFVSELLYKNIKVNYFEMDSCDENATFPYIKLSDNKLIYSKYNFETKTEEIIISDVLSNVKQVRLNTNIETASDLSYTYVINDIPCMLKNSEDGAEFISLNTQKQEYKLNSNMNFKFLINDFIVVTTKKMGIPFFRKEHDTIQVFHIDDLTHPIFTNKANFNGCLANEDNLIIFTN